MKTAEPYFSEAKHWAAEIASLRVLVRSIGLDETIKWGSPVYVVNSKNVVGIGSFKSYFGLWFFQGTLLDDPQGLLVNAQAGKTKAMRQMRFTDASQIKPRVIKRYLKQAIELAKRGEAIQPNRNKPLVVPEQLKQAFKTYRKAKASFAKMTLGKRREYADYISEAKREETKQRRIEKILPMIEDGVGLNDRYRNC
jgi:uncharacterized protein YdeI (YjbR/CyaY-like superfamily)